MRRATPALVIRPGRPGDLDAIHQLETTVFDLDRLSRRSLRRFLNVPTTDTIVADQAGRLVGYAMIGFRRDSTIGRLFSLAVAPTQARRGLGRMLLQACEASAWRRGCSAVRLEVRADNPAAITLYDRAGYVRRATYADYYEDGAAAYGFDKPRPAQT